MRFYSILGGENRGQPCRSVLEYGKDHRIGEQGVSYIGYAEKKRAPKGSIRKCRPTNTTCFFSIACCVFYRSICLDLLRITHSTTYLSLVRRCI